ncbi:MFS general substrate transporter [Cutaneotrichosporon oleaginosum]|uniref:MFS general substrate transporter n=1 Tax=Cutaneotrichosporon oleaginosum TaxID=879819 RepID=A0A0J0XGK2_9TREE|nr:MFS general substrate transporter [Cutaneotrichosporon oleaginosum]KLT40230.1 MFS general substrate transporter [Cutaneotrichosporon oleaginosum]TXT10480.1 hypothetical protein COLE_04414 [Cutaneotrichosporon oleaginosum]
MSTNVNEHVDDEHIPGTEVMRDHDGMVLRRAHGGKGQVLVPQPSNDPHDPLNWHWKWKAAAAWTQVLFVIFTVCSALSMAPMNGLAGQEWPNENEERIGLLTGGTILSLGYANFFIVPCSNIFGRRITSIVCSVLTIGFAVWEAVAKSYGSFLASRILTGVPTAINETMMVQVIADMFFIHERGRWMGVYFKAYFFGLFIGPIMSGNMAQLYGWRTFWWLCVAFGVFNTINLIFVFPETRFRREQAPQNATVLSASEKHTHGQLHLEHEGGDGSGSTTGSGHDTPPTVPTDVEAAGDAAVTGHGRPSKQQWKLWQPINPDWRRTIVKDVFSPWLKFFNPIILWAGCTMYGCANVLLFFNLTQQTLSGPPWNFSPSAMGYANFAFVVGGLIGLSTAGPLCDYVAKAMTVRNNGIREAEFRLIALIPFVIIAAIGIVVGGLGLERGWGWPVILCVGYGATGITVTSIPTIAVAYAVDSYTAIAGDIMVVATVIKNTTGFGMSYWVFSLVASKGLFTCAMVQFATCIGPAVLALPMYFFGKRIRRWTRNSSYHKEE